MKEPSKLKAAVDQIRHDRLTVEARTIAASADIMEAPQKIAIAQATGGAMEEAILQAARAGWPSIVVHTSRNEPLTPAGAETLRRVRDDLITLNLANAVRDGMVSQAELRTSWPVVGHVADFYWKQDFGVKVEVKVDLGNGTTGGQGMTEWIEVRLEL